MLAGEGGRGENGRLVAGCARAGPPSGYADPPAGGLAAEELRETDEKEAAARAGGVSMERVEREGVSRLVSVWRAFGGVSRDVLGFETNEGSVW